MNLDMDGRMTSTGSPGGLSGEKICVVPSNTPPPRPTGQRWFGPDSSVNQSGMIADAESDAVWGTDAPSDDASDVFVTDAVPGPVVS